MKKTLILLVISAIFTVISQTSVKAQETNAITTNAPSFGIKGGINISNLSTKEADQDKMLTGFNIGVFAKMPITNNIAIQPELYYTTKGAQVTYNSTFVGGTAKFNLNYIEMPLLLVVNLTDNFNIHFGPYISYLVDGKVTNESTPTAFNFENNINTDDYNKFEAGIAAGAGIDMGAFSLGARYSYGLTKVGKERTFLGTSYTFPDAKNGVASVYVAISFGQH